MGNIPRRNLGRDSEPWGRSVDERLLKMQGAIDLLQKDVKNSFKGVNSSISGVTRALSAVQTQQIALEQQQEDLESQQGQLANQTNRLTNTIAGLPNHQIRGDTTEFDSGITTSSKTFMNMSITVPSAHNYVWFVISNNGLFQADRYSGAGTLSIRTYIANSAESSGYGYWEANYNMSDNPYFNVSNTYQFGATVTPGSRVTVRINVLKTVSATTFYNKRLSSTFSIISYAR